MRAARHLMLPLAALGALGCSSTEPRPTYVSLAGTYAGPLVSTAQGLTLSATLTLAVTQNGGTLGGTYTLSGMIFNAATAQLVWTLKGSGTLSGSVAAGRNPGVTIAATFSSCPETPDAFNGSYDDTTRVATLAGSLYFFGASCEILVAFPLTITLSPS